MINNIDKKYLHKFYYIKVFRNNQYFLNMTYIGASQLNKHFL